MITEAVTDKRMTLEQIVARYNILVSEKLTAAWERKISEDITADKAAHPARWPQDAAGE